MRSGSSMYRPPLRMPPTPREGEAIVARTLTLQGHPVRLNDLLRGENVGDGGILPNAARGQVLVFDGERWVPADPIRPNEAHWVGAPASLEEAINRLAETLASLSGPIE